MNGRLQQRSALLHPCINDTKLNVGLVSSSRLAPLRMDQSILCVVRKRVHTTNYFHFPVCNLLLFSFADTASQCNLTLDITSDYGCNDAVEKVCVHHIYFFIPFFFSLQCTWATWKAFTLKIKKSALWSVSVQIQYLSVYLFAVHNRRMSYFWSYNSFC